ncbi:uncharacterized protein PRCAT00003732001 [Priceomyces carsonii]|uniref:uncharacterized protein n=1 Tax=Priceomyces carsonii TaxID=28549 RepID=UPI002ED849ED|nr:unnamed protein product [Priceomyces carsonii]
MSSNDEYERIALSKQDLRYLYGQLLQSVTSKLDLHLPTSNNDPLKKKVASALDDFLIGGFDMAKSALIIDGRNMSSKSNSLTLISDILSIRPREKVENFDVSINAKLREILLQVEEETTAVTKLRRNLPVRAKEIYDNLVVRTDQDITQILADLDMPLTPSDNEVDMTFADLPHLDEMASDYEKHILILEELKRSIPETRALLNKLNDTIQFLEIAYKKQEEENEA